MTDEERQRRLDRARFAIQAELLIGLEVSLLTGFLYVAAPRAFDPMFSEPTWIAWLVPAAPVVSLLAWIWMLRLSRPRLEAGEGSWRYPDLEP
jgi:hypothetical protein